MSVPEMHIVFKTISEKYNCSLVSIIRKKIMYHGVSAGKKLVLCTPYSKLHPQGMGWFDLTTKQVKLLDDSEIAILAVRLQGDKIYYLDFKELRGLMTSNIMLKNLREGEHWKLYVWENYIKVRGNQNRINVEPIVLQQRISEKVYFGETEI